jgi:DNA-binding LytR/AlgR family response regulator
MTSDTPTALIAEDEPLLAQALQGELKSAWPALQVVATVGDGASAVREALARQPDVLFFDIRMPGMSGLEAATELADLWPVDGAGAPRFPALVFVTAYDQYAVQAFEAQAVDYLLKPVQAARLQKTVAKLQLALIKPAQEAINFEATLGQLRGLLARGELGDQAPAHTPDMLKTLQVSVGAAIHMVPVNEVVYFEAADKYVRVLTAEREYLIRTPIKDLLPRLDPQQFWQIHRGTLVQSSHIARVLRDEAGRLHVSLRTRPEKLPISRLYAHLFKSM